MLVNTSFPCLSWPLCRADLAAFCVACVRNVMVVFSIVIIPLGCSSKYYGNTEGAGYLAIDLNAPPHTPQNDVVPNLSLSIGIDLDKLKVPPQSSLCYFRVGGLQLGPIRTCCSRHGLTFKDLMLESNCSSIDSPILFLACMYKSAIFAEESVVSHVGGITARALSWGCIISHIDISYI